MATVHKLRRNSTWSAPARRLLPYAAAVALLMAAHCAHQVFPSGGDPDETAPGVRHSLPAAGAVNVPLTTTIEFEFTEWVDPASAEKSIAMFPPPAEGMNVRAKGRTLQIRPRVALAESTTYHIELTNTLNDLRRNPVGKPHHLVFSTGATLDSGAIRGCVIDPLKRILQPKVALFAFDSSWSDTSLFNLPTYLAQTDSAGRYALEHIRRGEFVLLAFTDVNGDNLFQPGRETTYASAQRVVAVQSDDQQCVLYPTVCDTTSRRVARIVPISDRILSGLWTRRPPRKRAGKAEATFRIASTDTVEHEPVIARYLELKQGLAFALVLEEPMQLLPYQLYYDMETVMSLPDTVTAADSIRFNGMVVGDTARPHAVSGTSLSRADLSPSVRVVWSEPVRLDMGAATLADTIGDTVSVTVDTVFGDTTELLLSRRLKGSRIYRMRIMPDMVVDLSGLHPVDTAESSWIEIQVSTVHADSLCLTLSGGASCLPSDPSRMWEYVPFGNRGRYSVADSAGQFRFDSIPGSRGLLSLYGDRNGDGRYEQGELIPWTAPEPYVPFYDTVEARARWDIGGIDVPVCEPCYRGQLLSDSSAQSDTGAPAEPVVAPQLP